MLKNARIISIRVNTLSQSIVSKPELRTKKDNTTRLQILYGYDNYDTYSIRLDLAHEGEGFVHYNNKSPGGVRCCIFDETEYRSIISKHPQMADCFIRYGDRWMLKERVNCEISKEDKTLYEIIRTEKEHDPVLRKDYSEDAVVAFVHLIGKMLPQNCFLPIDRDEVNSKHCFSCDKIMKDVIYLYAAYFSCHEKAYAKLVERIVEKAICYNIITESEKIEYSCIDGISIIVECVKKRILD